MTAKQTNSDIVRTAAKALSDLNMLYAIIALAENSLMSKDCEVVTRKIITLCKSRALYLLAKYDVCLARLPTDKEGV